MEHPRFTASIGMFGVVLAMLGLATDSRAAPDLLPGQADRLDVLGALDLSQLDPSWWSCLELSRSDRTLAALVYGATGYTLVFLEPTWMTAVGYEPRHHVPLGRPALPWSTATLAASKDTVVVAVTSPVSKTIYVFERSGTAWLLGHTLEIPESQPRRTESHIAIGSDWIAVSGGTGFPGGLYLFRRQGGSWVGEGFRPVPSGFLVSRLAAADERLFVTASGGYQPATTEILDRVDGQWWAIGSIDHHEVGWVPGDGPAVAGREDIVAVGIPYAVAASGLVRIYAYDDGQWGHRADLIPAESGASLYHFGRGVAFTPGGRMVVSSPPARVGPDSDPTSSSFGGALVAYEPDAAGNWSRSGSWRATEPYPEGAAHWSSRPVTDTSDRVLTCQLQAPRILAWRLADGAGCVLGDTAICLSRGRFEVEVEWHSGVTSGVGRALPLTDDTGAFWFFRPGNLELAVKILDGRPINGSWWVFYGSLSNVGFTLSIRDAETGAVRRYVNPTGTLASRADTLAFPESGAVAHEPWSDDPATGVATHELTAPAPEPASGAQCAGQAGLCLGGGRFRVTVEWEGFSGEAGSGTARILAEDSGAFWFFREGNLELFVKLLDGRPVNGSWWVLYGSLTNVAFALRVQDLTTGSERVYLNPAGNFGSRADISAFP